MKTKFKFLTAVAALAVAFGSCSNYDEDRPVYEGEVAGLKIAIPVVKTYADNHAIPAEEAFNKAAVFVYNAGSLEKDTTILAADFEESEGKYVTKNPIIVMSGTKSVYVGLNMSDADVAAVRTGLQAPYATTAAAVSSSSTGFVMFSANDVNNNVFEISPDETTTIPVSVERWAAKVMSCITAGANSSVASAATISDFYFALGQMNTKMYPFQKLLVSGVIEDPNWFGFAETGGNYGPADFKNEFGTNDEIIESAYVAVDAYDANAPIADRNAKYTLENTSKDAKQGEVTYISVRAKFVPKAYHTFGVPNFSLNGEPTEITTPPTEVPELLYVVETNMGVTYYFADKDVADTYAASINATVKTYKDGTCYYFIFLDSNNEDNTYGVLRNTCFDSKITKVNSLGYPDPEVPGSELPLATSTKITVEVSILPWVPALSDEELGKI